MDIDVRDWHDTLAAASGAAQLVLTDPPYGTTRNKWEMALDPKEFYRLAFEALTAYLEGLFAGIAARPDSRQ